jgi:LysR family transcriptional regulator, transcriptional activator of nhaA
VPAVALPSRFAYYKAVQRGGDKTTSGVHSEWLNYHHLLYFWVVARHGSVSKASAVLRLAPPTISSQIHRLERALGQKLFVRRGRHLVPTELGQIAARYGDQIFALGQDLVETFQGRSIGPRRLVVGVSDVLAKSIVHRILEPAFEPELGLRVICKESRSLEAFTSELASHAMDVVLSDAPATRGSPVRMYSHSLGDCGTTWFAAPSLARKYRSRFPKSLDRAPMLLPTSDSTFRRELESWFNDRDIRPTVVAELDDAALLAVLGEKGLGIFAAADVIEDEVRRRYDVTVVGRSRQIRQRFFAISLERDIKHPGVAAICESARVNVFER